MRLRCVVVLIALLAAPVCVRGEDVAQPLSAGGKCSVRPDVHWTTPEKFVWRHICAGEEANFDTAHGYGGDLDPKRPEGLPESRIISSTFLETILLKHAYRSALTRRGVRIIGARFTETIDLENAELQHELWLDRSLLEKGADFAGLRSMQRITFTGSKVIGPVNMVMSRIDHDLSMNDSEFSDMDLQFAHIGDELDLSGSKVTGKLDMSSLRVGGHLASANAELQEVDLTSAHIGSSLELSGSKVTGKLDMNTLQVDGYLFMQDIAESQEVDLRGAHIGNSLDLTGSKMTGKLDMNSLQIGGLLASANTELHEVDLGSAHIDGSLDLGGSKVAGKLDMNGLQIGGLLASANAELHEVDLTGARIGSSLDLDGSKVAGKLNMNSLQVGGHLRGTNAEIQELDLGSAHAAGSLDLTGSKVTGKLDMNSLQVGGLLTIDNAELREVDLTSAHIGSSLELSGSKVTGKLDMNNLQLGGFLTSANAEFQEVDLTSARIGNSLDLSGSKVAGLVSCDAIEVGFAFFLGAKFSGDISCVLAKIGALDFSSGSFGGNVDLTGAQIAGELRLGAAWLDPATWSQGTTLILRNARADAIQDQQNAWPLRLDLVGFTYRSLGGTGGIQNDPMNERSAKLFRRWLSKQEPYAAAPYEQLAAVLRIQGRPDTADDVLYASRELERTQAPFLRRVWLTAIKLVIGYGYHVEWALIWVVGFLLAGIVTLRLSSQGPKNGMPYGIAFSFDRLLPIIQLRKLHDDIDLQGWARYYFYVHKIMGYVLASFLIAGLAGLTK